MALLANVALTNTFDTWRTRTNNLVTRLNQFAIDESKLYANTITANVRFVSAGSTRLGTTGSHRAIVNGLLSVNGNIIISGNTTINGNINLGDAATDLLTVTGRATVGTNLTVSGNTTLGGASKTITMGGASSTLTIGGAGHTTNTTGWFGVTGRASVSTNLVVGGNTSLLGTLNQSGGYGKIGNFNAGTTGNSPTTGGVAFSTNITNGQAEGDIWNAADPATYTSTGILFTQYLTSTTRRDLMFLKHNGLVGVGTLSPSYKLDVQGTLGVSTNLTVSGNTTINGTTTDRSNALSQTLTDGATISWDTSLGRVATVTLGGNRTMAAPTNLKVGTYILHVIQDGTGSRLITWNSVFKWVGAVAPVLSTTAGRRDIFSFVSDGTNLYGSFLPDVR